MAVPVREKRAWSARDKDAESKESAAFEASVAVAKDTVARSGAVLSSAKEDLTGHRRWLHAQSAAIEADRVRHDRWLQRQQEQRLALTKRERTKRRRQLMRQRAARAVQDAVSACLLFIRSLVLLLLAKTAAGLRYTARSIARGFVLAISWLKATAVRLGEFMAAGLRWTAAKLHVLLGWAGEQLSAGLAWVSAKAGAGARSAGRSLGAGFNVASVRASSFADTAAQAVSARTSVYGQAAGQKLATGVAWSKAQTLAPKLYLKAAELGSQAQRYARAAAEKALGSAARSRVAAAPAEAVEVYGPHRKWILTDGVPANEPFEPAPFVATPNVIENALSWGRARGVDLGQMLIISGVVLLICGGLLLGGGLVLRAGTPAVAEAGNSIAWFFEEPGRPLIERSLFTFTGTPQEPLITGVTIGGSNILGRELASIDGVLKPDVQRPELRLNIQPPILAADDGDA
ncbi:MAG: hypothetical protein ACREDO_13915, partial [Methyloceanibacter sp.]